MPITLRPTTFHDQAAIDRLLSLSYPMLLAPDYSAEVLAAVLPAITRAKPALLQSGTYFVLENGREALAAGGWTAENPARGGAATPGEGHIRHVVGHPDHLRRGHARQVMTAILDQARQQGIRRMECLSTRTAEPFYSAIGFARLADVDVELSSGLTLPSVRMILPL